MRHASKIITGVLYVSVFLSVLDFAIVTPALTAIIQEWRVPYHWGIWTVTLYLLALVISMPLMRRLAKTYGRQFIIWLGLSLFGAGALCSGFSSSLPVLLAGRFLQGVAGGGLLTLASSLLMRREVERRDRSMAALLAAGAIFAFLLGSVFVTTLHWRFVFFLQVAIAFCAATFVWCKPTQSVTFRKSFDVAGMILLTCMILSLMVGITSIKREQFWQSLFGPEVFPFIVVAFGLAIPFVMVERQQTDPLIPLHYFRHQQNVLVSTISLFSGVGWVSLLFIPAFFENAMQLEAGGGGYVLVILALMAVASSMMTVKIATRFGTHVPTMSGFLLAAAGFLLFGVVELQLTGTIFAVSVLGLGLGMSISTISNPSAVVKYFLVTGLTVGAAALVTFLTQATDRIPERVRDSLIVTSPGTREVSGGIFADLVAGSSQFIVPNAEKLRELIPDHIAASTQELILRQIMRVMRDTLAEGYQNLFLTSAVVFLIGFVSVVILDRIEKNGPST